MPWFGLNTGPFHMRCLLLLVFYLSMPPITISVDDHGGTTLSVCDNDKAAMNWPSDIPYDLVQTMTLTHMWSNRQDQPVVSIVTNGSVTVSDEFSQKITVRGTTGVYLEDITLQDSGAYKIHGRFLNGSDFTRHLFLVVHLPPLLQDGAVRIQMNNMSTNCQGLSCGRLLFVGYPPVSYTWETPRGVVHSKASELRTVINGCPLVTGNYTCRLTGEAVQCLGSHFPVEESLFVNVSDASGGKEDLHDLILIITIPIAAVLSPLIILGLWVLRHMCSNRNIYTRLKQEPGPPDLERGASVAGTSSPPQSPSDLEPEPTFTENEASDGEDIANDDDDQTTPMVKPDPESGSEKETRI